MKPLSGYVHNFSISQVHQSNIDQNNKRLYMPDSEFTSYRIFFSLTVPSIKYTKNKFR